MNSLTLCRQAIWASPSRPRDYSGDLASPPGGFPGRSAGKESACKQETPVCFLGQEDALGEGIATHSSILAWRIPVDRGTWWAAVHGVAQSRTWLKRLSRLHALGKEMATQSSILAWRIPGTEEPGGLPSMGLHRVEHNWSELAAAAAESVATLQLIFLISFVFLLLFKSHLTNFTLHNF